MLIGIAGCGISASGPTAGQAASVNLSLTTVPTIRSVTVSPPRASFGTCSGGRAKFNTRSTLADLGYPDGRCWVGYWAGALNPSGIFPITITNTGIASYIDVNGANATPADDGDQWSLCNIGNEPAITCSGRGHHWPGTDQYLVQNFGPGARNSSGLTDNPQCDRQFDLNDRCWAMQGASQTEGIELTGPYQTIDSSTKWTVTITWTPVP